MPVNRLYTMKHVNVVVISQSQLLVSGISNLLDNIREYAITVTAFNSCAEFNQICDIKPSVVIVEPLLMSHEDISEIRGHTDGRCRMAAICHSVLPACVASEYDAVVSIYDNTDTIINTVLQLLQPDSADEETKVLSQREKEVVKYIVKGLSNKEIAADMNVSVNTVMTHRRNIASKLQIHSTAGLTIYAIVSKLVSLEEISSYNQP